MPMEEYASNTCSVPISTLWGAPHKEDYAVCGIMRSLGLVSQNLVQFCRRALRIISAAEPRQSLRSEIDDSLALPLPTVHIEAFYKQKESICSTQYGKK